MRTAAEEFNFADALYRAPRLCAFDQFRALHLLQPALTKIQEDSRPRRRGLPPAPAPGLTAAFIQAIEAMGAETLEDLFNLCLSGVERQDDGEWLTVWDPETGSTAFEDLGAGRTVTLVARMLLFNLRAHLAHKPVAFESAHRGLNFEPVQLDGGLSWLMRPVERNMCRYESLKDGTLDLADIALMNDQLSVSAENQMRAQKAAEAERRQP